MFDEAILARMITDHRQNARGAKRIPEGRERRAKSLEFVVDRNAERLKAAGEIGGPAPGTERGPDGVHQVIAGPEEVAFPPTYDFPGQSCRAGFIAVVPEDGGELREGGPMQEIRRGLIPSLPRHPHVERDAGPKGEAALVGVELPG